MKLGTDKLRDLRPKAPTGNGAAAVQTRPVRRASRLGYRTRTLGLAALLAVLAIVLVVSYVRSYKSGVDVRTATGTALVAGRDIEPGTPASALGGGVLVPRQVVRVPGAVSSPDQLRGLVVAEPIYAGEQVTIRRFTPAGQEGIRRGLRGTSRAVVLPGDRNQLLGGVLSSGDRVDVVAAIKRARAGGGEEAVTRVVLSDLLVLAGGEDAEQIGAGGKGASAAVLLQVTDRQAQKLFYAIKNGEWMLQLRPYGRAAESPPFIDNADSVLGLPSEPSP